MVSYKPVIDEDDKEDLEELGAGLKEFQEDSEAKAEVLREGQEALEAALKAAGDTGELEKRLATTEGTLAGAVTNIHQIQERADHAVSLAEAATKVGEGQVSAAETIAAVEELKGKVGAVESSLEATATEVRGGREETIGRLAAAEETLESLTHT